MIAVDTGISWGYLPLLEIFAQANSLVFKFEAYNHEIREEHGIVIAREHTRIMYEDNSDTAMSVTFMSIRHLGFENMLCDYLIKCNVNPSMISTGSAVMRKDPEQMEKDWQEHRKKIGLTR